MIMAIMYLNKLNCVIDQIIEKIFYGSQYIKNLQILFARSII